MKRINFMNKTTSLSPFKEENKSMFSSKEPLLPLLICRLSFFKELKAKTPML